MIYDPMVKSNTFHSPRAGLLYFSIPKVACSSVKTWLCQIESIPIHRSSSSIEVELSLDVHNSLKSLAELTDREFHDCLYSSELEKLLIVRNPYRRFFSGFMNKIIMREPAQMSVSGFIYEEAIEYEDIGRVMEEYALHLYKNKSLYLTNPHWAPQVNVSAADSIKHDVILKLEDMEDVNLYFSKYLSLIHDLPVATNSGLLKYDGNLFTERCRSILDDIYRVDLARYNYEFDWNEKYYSEDYKSVVMRAISIIRKRHEVMAKIWGI